MGTHLPQNTGHTHHHPVFDPCLLWPTRGQSQFLAHFYCGQTAGYTKMPLGMELGLNPGDFVLDGDLAPSPKRGRSPLPPNFPAHVFFCGKTAGWIKMALGMGVGFSPGDFVLDGDPAPSPKWGPSPVPNFRQISTVPKRLDASRCHVVWR